jgi:protein phosphatase
MGTTLTLVALDRDGKAHFAHVGDSRAYLVRDGVMRQMTADHTVAADLVARGQLTPQEAVHHPQRHMLTRVLGLTRFLNVDEEEVVLEPGDRILLCSDGLIDMVTDYEIQTILAAGTPEEATWELIEAANAAGGVDNISVIVIEALE